MKSFFSSIQIALLKLLLTSTPTARPKTESINILCDVIPEEMPCSMVQTMKLGFDINRHKVIKSILIFPGISKFSLQ